MTLLHALDLALAAGWLALAATLLRWRMRPAVTSGWLVVGACFCLMRAADLMLSASGRHLPTLAVLLQAGALGLLLAAIYGTDRLRQQLATTQDAAVEAEREYGRALLDYTQLVRHRIANPLTAVTGGIQTLLDLELDMETRRQLLCAMLEKARELERVALHPERVSGVERELQPVPAPGTGPEPSPLAGEHPERALARSAAIVEADYRDLNRQLVESAPHDQHVLTFMCECSARECGAPITASLVDYFAAHADATHFIVAPGHNLPSVEEVLQREPAYWVVRKTDDIAKAIARRRD